MKKDNRIFIIIGLLIVAGIVVYVIVNSEDSSSDLEISQEDGLAANEVGGTTPVRGVESPEVQADSTSTNVESVSEVARAMNDVPVDSGVDSGEPPFPGMGAEELIGTTTSSGPSLVDVGSNESLSPGVYTPYTNDAAIVAAAERGEVVLFFHAPWCPTCRTLDQDIMRNADSIPSGLTIFKVNYDTASELKRRYQVQYQHTLVLVDEDLAGVRKWAGSSQLSAVLDQV